MSGSNTVRMEGGWKPAMSLFVLAPMTGELITSSAPPFVFFIPWVFALFALLYGCGAILVRELAVRWNAGWPGVLLLGAAYGIIEEGLGAKSFFDPNWRAIGMLGSHGRWMGVNWVWTLGLILFHAAFCIGTSVLAVEVMFRRHRGQAWLSNRWLWAVGVAYAFVALLFYQKGNENGYQAPSGYYLACLGAAAVLAGVARFAWRNRPAALAVSPVPAKRLAWAGFAGIVLFVFVLYFLPAAGWSAWWTGAALLALAGGVAHALWRWTKGGTNPLSIHQEYSLMAGAYGAFALQAPFQEFHPNRAGAAAGMTFTGMACVCWLFWLRRNLIRDGLMS